MKPVSYSPDGLDHLGIGGILFDLFSQIVNVNRNCGHISHCFHAPDPVKNPFSGKGNIRVSGKKHQNFKFPACQFQKPSLFQYPVGIRIDFQIPGLKGFTT